MESQVKEMDKMDKEKRHAQREKYKLELEL